MAAKEDRERENNGAGSSNLATCRTLGTASSSLQQPREFLAAHLLASPDKQNIGLRSLGKGPGAPDGISHFGAFAEFIKLEEFGHQKMKPPHGTI